MKVQVKHGVDTKFPLDMAGGATVEDVLKNRTTLTVCGEQGSARVNGVEVPILTPIKEGDVIEPVTVANEKSE